MTLEPDVEDTLIRGPSVVRVDVPKLEETTENALAQVVAEVMNPLIGAQEQMAQRMQTQSYQIAPLTQVVSTNPQPIPVTNSHLSTSTIATLLLSPESSLSGVNQEKALDLCHLDHRHLEPRS